MQAYGLVRFAAPGCCIQLQEGNVHPPLTPKISFRASCPLDARLDPSINIFGKPADSSSTQQVRPRKFAGMDFFVNGGSLITAQVLYFRKTKESPVLLRHR